MGEEVQAIDPSQAKKMIAAYVAGHRVPQEVLKEACRAIRTDLPYLEHLCREFGLAGDWISECEIFRSRLAEFCNMSAEERRDEVPELLDHLGICPACQRGYWSVKPLWIAATEDPSRTDRKHLAEAIGVMINPQGVRKIGLGPLPLAGETTTPLGVALGVPRTAPEPNKELAAPPKPRQEWLLNDLEAKCAIQLAVVREPSGDACVRIDVKSEASSEVQRQAIHIEVLRSEQDLPVIAGRLADIQPDGVTLEPGSWIIQIQQREPDKSRQWAIPIEIEEENLND